MMLFSLSVADDLALSFIVCTAVRVETIRGKASDSGSFFMGCNVMWMII